MSVPWFGLKIDGEVLDEDFYNSLILATLGQSPRFWDMREGFDCIERWEWLSVPDMDWWISALFKAKYMGRVGAYWTKDAQKAPDDWLLPNIQENVVDAADYGVDDFPWNNCIKLNNLYPTDDSQDAVYFAFRKSFQRARFRWRMFLPTINATNFPNGSQIYIGFEAPFMGGVCIASFAILDQIPQLFIQLINDQGVNINYSVAVTGNINHENAWGQYILEWNPPLISIYQPNAGRTAFELLEQVRIPNVYGYPWMIPFVANESTVLQGETASSTVLINQLSVWKLEEPKYVSEMEYLRKSIIDGNYEERWEQGFRRGLYRGRTGGYYASDSTNNRHISRWALPELEDADNGIEPAPWNDSLRMRNSQDGVVVDHLYVGCPISFPKGTMVFDALLPAPGVLTDLYVGFEVNSGGSYALICALACVGGQWHLRNINYRTTVNTNLNLRHPGVWARYALVYDPSTPSLVLWEAQVTGPTDMPLQATTTSTITNIEGVVTPFFANEMDASVSEFSIGNFWIYEIP